MFKSLRLTLALFLSALAIPLIVSSGASAATKPSCVVSLSPTATETLYAIGAGKQVQAVDTDSNYPKTGLPKKRINALDPSVEAIIGICKTTSAHPSSKPNLVIISYDANDIKEKLTAQGIKVIEQDAPTNEAGALFQIRQLGTLSGHLKKADTLAASIKTTIAADVASVPKHPGKTLTAYYELDTTYYSLTSSTFVGSLLKELGVVNIADPKNTTADAGYPQLSAEYIVSANPKMILLADTICCKASAATVAKRPGFSNVAAVKDGEVIGLNDDIASRWGPRLSLLMNQLTASVKGALKNSKLWQ
ncbi:MAG TPA: ABC transporter substrate-binding protein [Acidimicrobiales bacterium]|nr:ABC transporter substrate-binding protein [Acidimicrobiales bacterium]